MNDAHISRFLADEAATRQFAEDLALAAAPGDCLALSGDLGSGKSTLARAFIRTIADDEALDVPSPTFTLVQSYDLRIPVAHFDLYRIGSEDEMEELGLDEAHDRGIALIEWPQKAGGRIPADAIHVDLREEADGRRIDVTGPQAAMDRISRSLTLRTFLDREGFGRAKRRHFQGDASTRRFESIRPEKGKAFILMDSPQMPDGPVIRDGKPYSQLAHLAETVVPFVAVDLFLNSVGLRVPDILGHSLDDGILLVGDLGRTGILDDGGRPLAERMEAAIDCLVKLHRTPVPERLPVPGRPDYPLPSYDAEAMQIEIELFVDWYLPHFSGLEITEEQRDGFVSSWRNLFSRLDKAERTLVLRDFHSPNILWNATEKGTDRIGLIDFQDALLGPSAYDVASLVQDARVTVPEGLADRLIQRYLSARKDEAGFDPDTFIEALAITEAQRATKILGIFVRLNLRDRKPVYMAHLPRVETYLKRALQHPSLRPLHEHYKRAGIAVGESE
jgi:hypothetical protein